MVKQNFHVSQRILGDIQENFKAAKEKLNTLKDDPGNDVKLKLYALFKQVSSPIYFSFSVVFRDKSSQMESEKKIIVFQLAVIF